MKYKYLGIAIFLFLPLSFTLGQTLELFGQKVTFGATLSEQKNDFWQVGGQLESEYSFIEIFEGEKVNGEFYKGQLVYLYINAWDNNPYPVCEEIENILSNFTPYKQFTLFDETGYFIELYKTNEYYISRSSSRMNTDYTFIPIKFLDDIRKLHPEYLSKLF